MHPCKRAMPARLERMATLKKANTALSNLTTTKSNKTSKNKVRESHLRKRARRSGYRAQQSQRRNNRS